MSIELVDLSRVVNQQFETGSKAEDASLRSQPRETIGGRFKITNPTHRTIYTVFQLCAISFWSSFTSGLVTVGLPTIAEAIQIPNSLYLWPSSVLGLASGATLLLAGAVADLIGPYNVEVVGCTLVGIFTLACGFASTGIQLVIFRAFHGIGLSMHLPASVALVAAATRPGKGRNLGFACLGLSQPLGFSFGMVISGFMIESSGWRSCFYLSGSAGLAAAAIGLWILPRTHARADAREHSLLRTLWLGVDWIGGTLASAGFALVSYVLAIVSDDLHALHHPGNAIMLAVGLLLLVLFPLWMHYREAQGKPALIPNKLWKRSSFASVCVMVLLSWGVLNSLELFSSLYFQEIQKVSPIFTSLRLLPSLLVGTLVGLTVGLFVDKVSARWLVAVSSVLCACAAMLMAVVDPYWNYWYMQFWAQVLSPLSGDVLFTVGLLVVSDQFPEDTQALAGAVFNTMSQFGWSLGIGICQVVALGVGTSGHAEHSIPLGSPAWARLLQGYRAAFWTMFAMMLLCGLIAVGGLRKAGKVGTKRD
jgi:MFS family permease